MMEGKSVFGLVWKQKGPEGVAPGLSRVVLGLLAKREREGFNLLT